MDEFVVYILYSEKFNKNYTGFTTRSLGYVIKSLIYDSADLQSVPTKRICGYL